MGMVRIRPHEDLMQLRDTQAPRAIPGGLGVRIEIIRLEIIGLLP